MVIESALQTLRSRFQKKVGNRYKRAPEGDTCKIN
jgi:hypothetical protein